MNYPFNQQKKLIKPPKFKTQNQNNKNSVNYYNESTPSPSLDEVLEPVYNKNNKKRRKRKRNCYKNKVNKSLQFPTQVPQHAPKPVRHVQQLLSYIWAEHYPKVEFNEELDRRALLDTGAFTNVISREFYKELIKTNFNSITEIEKSDLDKFKLANGNIVKIDKAIKVTFKLFTFKLFTEDFLVLIVTTLAILINPFFVKHKVSMCPGQSYLRFLDETVQINEIKPEKQPRRVVKRFITFKLFITR